MHSKFVLLFIVLVLTGYFFFKELIYLKKIYILPFIMKIYQPFSDQFHIFLIVKHI